MFTEVCVVCKIIDYKAILGQLRRFKLSIRLFRRSSRIKNVREVNFLLSQSSRIWLFCYYAFVVYLLSFLCYAYIIQLIETANVAMHKWILLKYKSVEKYMCLCFLLIEEVTMWSPTITLTVFQAERPKVTEVYYSCILLQYSRDNLSLLSSS